MNTNRRSVMTRTGEAVGSAGALPFIFALA